MEGTRSVRSSGTADPSSMIDFKYRPEVDGLRAVAVTLVLLFHAGLGFSGGFIGVDVFFVISGFLITGLILKEQDAGTFRLANFWVRRIRRIIPAVTVLAVAVLAAGVVLLLPSDYEDLGKSTIAQQLMLSNVYFWRNTGYFDGAAELMPLLHTWSLAVEEQFYLGYPFLLMLLHPLGRRPAFTTLALLAAVSLAASEYGVRTFPSATFFLLPTRAWELLIGGLICFLPKPIRGPSWLVAAVSWLSLAAILGAGWFYTAATPFPGLTALVPCAATAALIYANSVRLTRPAALLAKTPLVFVGRISYSLYLWHWPLLVFARLCLGDTLPWQVGLSVLALSVALAVLSWRYVETPFRRAVRPARWRAVAAAWGSGTAILLCVAGLIWQTRGLAAFYSPEVLALDPASVDPPIFRYETQTRDLENGRVRRMGDSADGPTGLDFVVWGDSHAMAVGSLVETECRRFGCHGAILANRATAPIAGWAGNSSERDRWARSALNFLVDTRPGHVLLTARWSAHFRSPNAAKAGALRSTIDTIQKSGSQVWILMQVPEQKYFVPQALWLSRRFGAPDPRGVSPGEFDDASREFRSVVQTLPAGVKILDPGPDCFDSDGQSKLAGSDGCYYRDTNHLSRLGCRELLGRTISRWFAEVK